MKAEMKITIEGGCGIGKSTVAQALGEWFKSKGVDVSFSHNVLTGGEGIDFSNIDFTYLKVTIDEIN